jgi:DNA-directed RNA polymerase delta subunit
VSCPGYPITAVLAVLSWLPGLSLVEIEELIINEGKKKIQFFHILDIIRKNQEMH